MIRLNICVENKLRMPHEEALERRKR